MPNILAKAHLTHQSFFLRMYHFLSEKVYNLILRRIAENKK